MRLHAEVCVTAAYVVFLYYGLNDKVRCVSYSKDRNLRKERLPMKTAMHVLSSSYVLYLDLLLGSKVVLACEKTLVKQWHR